MARSGVVTSFQVGLITVHAPRAQAPLGHPEGCPRIHSGEDVTAQFLSIQFGTRPRSEHHSVSVDFQLSCPLFPICVFALVRSWSAPGEIALFRGGYTIEFFDLPSVVATNTTCYPQGFATPGTVRSITFATRSRSSDQPENLLAAGVALRSRLRSAGGPSFHAATRRAVRFLTARVRILRSKEASKMCLRRFSFLLVTSSHLSSHS